MNIKLTSLDKLEPLAEDVLFIDQKDASVCASLRSIAISLVRIADSVDMGDTDEHMCIPKSLGVIAHALAGDTI